MEGEQPGCEVAAPEPQAFGSSWGRRQFLLSEPDTVFWVEAGAFIFVGVETDPRNLKN